MGTIILCIKQQHSALNNWVRTHSHIFTHTLSVGRVANLTSVHLSFPRQNANHALHSSPDGDNLGYMKLFIDSQVHKKNNVPWQFSLKKKLCVTRMALSRVHTCQQSPYIRMKFYSLIDTSYLIMPAFLTSTSKYIPWEIPKNYRPISQCSRKWECIRPFIQNCIKNKWGLFWETHFCYPADQPTNKQTDSSEIPWGCPYPP